MTRRNHRNGGGKTLYIGDLAVLALRYLPEITSQQPLAHPSKHIARENRWRTIKTRPEIIEVLDKLAERYAKATGKKITNSEIIAAALNLSLPVLATRLFPQATNSAPQLHKPSGAPPGHVHLNIQQTLQAQHERNPSS